MEYQEIVQSLLNIKKFCIEKESCYKCEFYISRTCVLTCGKTPKTFRIPDTIIKKAAKYADKNSGSESNEETIKESD